jgi:hypothetical protein
MSNKSSTSSFAATSLVACRRMPQPHIQAEKWRSRNLPCNVPPTLISSRPIARAPPIKVSSLEREPLARCSRCASSLSASFYSITEPVFLILPLLLASIHCPMLFEMPDQALLAVSRRCSGAFAPRKKLIWTQVFPGRLGACNRVAFFTERNLTSCP